jgi:SNF2 family DNA or RNA helicase
LKNTSTLLPAERAAQVQRRIEEIRMDIAPPMPAEITASLRPYQTQGFHFLAFLSANNFGGVLADDMGLGKTLQALTWLAWLRSTGTAADPVLVICPKSVQENWRSEAARFFPSLPVQTWTRAESGALPKKFNGLLIIHYAQLRQHEALLQPVKWAAVILDEAQAIKNPTSQTTAAACALHAAHRLALTGTPVENRLMDLWSIFAFAMPGLLGTRASFNRQFDSKTDPLARRRLAARTRPFLLRRTKKEVASDLPERVEEDVLVELEGTQAALYQAELKRARAQLLNISTGSQLDKLRFNILTSLLRLRQICCHPALLGVEEKAAPEKPARGKKKAAAAAAAPVESAKLSALMEHLESIIEEEQKVLVFSQFTGMLDLIAAETDARGWKRFHLTGQTEDRGALVNAFQNHEGPAVFLISLKAGGFGLNLTAASYVVLYDPWWNPAVEAQAIDRTHRIGQQQTVFAYRLLVKDSIEEKIRALQKQKGALAHDILGEENFARALSLDDFRFLLGE